MRYKDKWAGLILAKLINPAPNLKETDMKTKQNPRDEQAPQTGKVANDHNKVGDKLLTQKNEPKRTPDSRTDREAHIGSGNQTQSRRGATGR